MIGGMNARDVVDFWREAGPSRWFRKDEAFDAAFRDRFLALHEAAAAAQLAGWEQTAEGSLALVILLDQFPRNAFRNSPRTYATDPQARSVAAAAIDAGFDREVPGELRPFFYIPFMHSELLADLDRCVELMEPIGGENLRYARHHRDIVARFGRFPHRNSLLGRVSTAEEQRFLDEGGFTG
ncbi:MAG: DUF924 family protein [Burkholderiales bacterium]|nr:DUF924 family protein [Burkholderiales bacterium]